MAQRGIGGLPWLHRHEARGALSVTAPHRTMFLAGSAWAIVAVGPVSWDVGLDPAGSPLGGAVEWHGHEMVFGFAAAMFAGYALTAMASWPGTPRLSHGGTVILFCLWVLGRLAAAGALGRNPHIVVPAAAAFLAFVSIVLVRAALGSASAKGVAFVLFALAMTALQIAVLCEVAPQRLPVLGFAALLSVVGGRMVTAFTRNGLAGCEHHDRRVRRAGLFAVPGSVAVLMGFGLESAGAASALVAVCLLIAAASEALRVFHLLSRAVLRDYLLVMLHIGYSWLPIGLFLVAWAAFPGAEISPVDALHALTAGAIACSIHAIATRAVARRADRLRPSPIDVGGFALLWSAAMLRVFAPVDTVWRAAAAVAWCIAWAVFLGRHGRAALRPPVRPVFSGPKRAISVPPDDSR